jgi:heme a synthase
MSIFYPNHPREHQRPVVKWLSLMLGLIVVMVAIGGITRLTESGLSITEWKPVSGALPPSGEAAWAAEFAKYKESPEYRLRRAPDMSLDQFKRIFFWEWLHRNWGRMIGVVYVLPCLWFLARRRVRGRQAAFLAAGIFLIGLQGWVGWFMVKSGLAANPFVSHYRLATHFMLALLLFGYLLWVRQSLWPEIGPTPHEPESVTLENRLWIGLAVVAVQCTWGAFTAGLDAGMAYNTFPYMLGKFVPPGMLAHPAGAGDRWLNLLDSVAGVQFVHRWLGTAVFLYLMVVWYRAQKFFMTERQRNFLNGVLICICAQFVLGIATLVNRVPLKLAVAHQVTAVLLVGCLVASLQALRAARPRRHNAVS